MFLRFNLRNCSPSNDFLSQTIFSNIHIDWQRIFDMSSFPINIYFSQKVTGLFTFHNSFTSNLHEYTIHIYTRVHIKTIILHSSMCSFQTTNTYTSNRGTFSKHKHHYQHLKFESQIFTPVNIDLVLRCIGIHNVLYWIVLLIKMNKREQDSTFFFIEI